MKIHILRGSIENSKKVYPWKIYIDGKLYDSGYATSKKDAKRAIDEYLTALNENYTNCGWKVKVK